jgi:hypothetical protein
VTVRLIRLGLWIALASVFIYEQTVMFNVPIPDSSYWPGDETWLMREYKTQMETGRFRFPEAYGSTLAIGSGLAFNNMWITSTIYGVPYAVAGRNGIVIGRIVSIVLSTLLLGLLYREGRRRGVSHEGIAFALLLLMMSEAFIYTSHSARYDLIAALAITAIVIVCARLLECGATSGQLVILGSLPVLAILVTPHVLLSAALPLGYTLIALPNKQRWHYPIVVGSTIAAAALVFALYLVTGNTDFTFIGPTLPGTQSNVRDGYFLLAKVGSVADAAQLLWDEVVAFRQALAPLALGCIAIGLTFILNSRRDTQRTRAYYTLIALVIAGFVLTEGHFIRSQVYVAPVLALAAMLLWRDSVQVRPVLARVLLVLLVPWMLLFFIRGSAAATIADRIVDDLKVSHDKIIAAIAQHGGGGRLLLDTHTLGYFLDDSGDRAMADLFLWHAATHEPFLQTLKRFDAKWAVRACKRGEPTLNYRLDIDEYLKAHAKVVLRMPGLYTDINTSYRIGQKHDTEDIIVYGLE